MGGNLRTRILGMGRKPQNRTKFKRNKFARRNPPGYFEKDPSNKAVDPGSTDIDGGLDQGDSFVLHYFILRFSISPSCLCSLFIPFDM
jgi:hypothetical protein